jgi:dolichol-phosphate mannosyltransferase
MKICLVLPTLNEEKGVKKVIEDIPNPVVSDIVVVDGYSGDNTIITAKTSNKKTYGMTVLFQDGYGKGMAFQSFLKKFDLDGFDAYVMFDADYTYDPKEIKKIVFPIVNKEADVVMGNRFSFKGIKDVMTPETYLGNRLLTLAASFLYFKNPKDLCTGYWAFSKKFLKNIKIRARGFDLEANLFTEAVKKGFRIKTVPIKYRARIGQKKLRYYDGLLILWRLIKERFL